MSGTGELIFVVDDDPALCRLITFVLKSEGYEVEAFEDPRVALDRLSSRAASMIVLDIMMPDLDGVAFYREGMSRGAAFPIFLLSASTKLREVASTVRAAGYMPKPFDPESFLDQLERALTSVRRARVENAPVESS